MVKVLDTTTQTEVDSRASTFTTCWKITRIDGVVLGFTSFQRDIDFDGVTYSAMGGYTPSALQSNSELAVDNMDLEGIVHSNGLLASDIQKGRYDYAEVEVFWINYENPTGKIILRRGNMGEITLRDGLYVTEIRSLVQRLTRKTIRIVTPDCDAEVYDARCGIASTSFQNTGTVAGIVEANRVYDITISGTARSAGYFVDGKLEFTSGDANGYIEDVKAHTKDSGNERITVFLKVPFAVAVSDTVLLKRGCSKLFSECVGVFSNGDNYRGFPDVPGNDKMVQTPEIK